MVNSQYKTGKNKHHNKWQKCVSLIKSTTVWLSIHGNKSFKDQRQETYHCVVKLLSKNYDRLMKVKQATCIKKSVNLWCHVIWRSTKCFRCLVTEHAFLAHSKISELYVAIRVKHHVVQLQISAMQFILPSNSGSENNDPI